MKPLSQHLMLVKCQTFDDAVKTVEAFFNHTMLVRYSKIEIDHEQSCGALDDFFFELLDQGLDDNRNVLERFINEFKSTGFENVNDFSQVEHGYPSKLLHIITHFLDGFIGIDTRFYNLVDDSHSLSEASLKKIKKKPKEYWLISVAGFSDSPETAGLIQQ